MAWKSMMLSPVLAIGCLSGSAWAVAPGQTGAFPSTGDWSGTTAGGQPWDLEHSYVYQWNTFWNGQRFPGSAVAVAPNYLLTAGHVGATAGESYAMINGVKYTAVSVLTPPADPSQSASPDLCLVKVDHTLPGYNSLFTGTVSYSQDVFLIGYGLTGTYSSSNNVFTLSGGTDEVGRWGTNQIAYTPYRDTSNGHSSMLIGVNTYDSDTPYEAFLGNGDSGGGMFVKVGDQWQLAGINAYDYATFGGYYASSAVNVSTYANWIASNAPVPEPSGLLVLAGATCMLALRRRRLAL